MLSGTVILKVTSSLPFSATLMNGLLKSTPVQPSGGVFVIAIISSPVPKFSTSIVTETGIPTVASTVLSESSTDKSIQYSWLTMVIMLTVLFAYLGGFSF